MRQLQFSLATLLTAVSAIAVVLAGTLQVPHVLIFAISGISVLVAGIVTFRIAKKVRPRIIAGVSLIASGLAFYVLSLGPFIMVSEIDRKVTGQYHLARLSIAYLPAMRLNRAAPFRWYTPFRWYLCQWIPSDAVGLHVLYPTRISQNLVGTWQTGGTQVVNLRPDGTGRAYGSLTTSDLIYCEWASDASKFAIYQYASKRSASAWLGCVFMNSTPTDSFHVVESSATHFKLRDKTGRIISLTKSHDDKLESAP